MRLSGKDLFGPAWLIILALTLGTASRVLAEQAYVSLKGQFYITYPDDWEQIDYRIVDSHLLRHQVGQSILDYEAAFAPKGSVPFFAGDYFILTVDTLGRFSDKQIDSVLNDLRQVFRQDFEYRSVAEFMVDPKADAPSYDAETGTVTFLTDISEQGRVIKYHLLMMKFYDRGMATFYFYSPESRFAQSASLFNQIVSSLSIDNIEEALPRETLKVADIEEGERESTGREESSTKYYLYIGVALVLILLMVIRRLR